MKNFNKNPKEINVESFFETFQKAYCFYQKKEFNLVKNDGEGRVFVRTLCAYFLNKNGFYKSPILNKKSVPNLEKGLLVIGNYGTGKTSIFNTFYLMFFNAFKDNICIKTKDELLINLGHFKLNFGFHSSNEIVREFECLKSPEERNVFWKKYGNGTRYFDDLTTEHQASNFGKIELFKDILEARYSNKTKTFISLNFHGNSVEETLDFLAEKYGERVYDRLFEMFNIIELKGKSFRE